MKIKILYVEDNPRNYDLMIRVLELKGYYVIHYSNPDKVLEDIKEGLKYDIALVDQTLVSLKHRIIEGLDILKASKKYNPEVPVYSNSSWEVANKKYYDGFLPKVYFEKKLELIIKEHFG